MKKWRTYQVDDELEDSWLEALNAPEHFQLVSVCAGHLTSRLDVPHANYVAREPIAVCDWPKWEPAFQGCLSAVVWDNVFIELILERRLIPKVSIIKKDVMWVKFCAKEKTDLADWFAKCAAAISNFDILLGSIISISLPNPH